MVAVSFIFYPYEETLSLRLDVVKWQDAVTTRKSHV